MLVLCIMAALGVMVGRIVSFDGVGQNASSGATLSRRVRKKGVTREGKSLETTPAVSNDRKVPRVYTDRREIHKGADTTLNAARCVPGNSHTQSLSVKYSTKSPHSMV
jgi:hypothetical protein